MSDRAPLPWHEALKGDSPEAVKLRREFFQKMLEREERNSVFTRTLRSRMRSTTTRVVIAPATPQGHDWVRDRFLEQESDVAFTEIKWGFKL